MAFFHRDGAGLRVDGTTTAVEDGAAWCIAYTMWMDPDWTTRAARVRLLSASGARRVSIVSQSPGRWLIDGKMDRLFDGCLDIDLEASALTNALPVRRMALGVGEASDAPALYVRATDLRPERLEQRYERVPHEGAGESYDYSAPRFDFACRLVYDEYGLVLSYPGIASRIPVAR